MPIAQANVYPALDREQWTGYVTGYLEIGGERVTFTTIAAGFPKNEGEVVRSYQTDEEAAWHAFDLGLKDWLKDKPGVVLWRMEPTLKSQAHYELDTFNTPEPRLVPRIYIAVVARVAVTENRAFIDAQRVEEAAA